VHIRDLWHSVRDRMHLNTSSITISSSRPQDESRLLLIAIYCHHVSEHSLGHRLPSEWKSRLEQPNRSRQQLVTL